MRESYDDAKEKGAANIDHVVTVGDVEGSGGIEHPGPAKVFGQGLRGEPIDLFADESGRVGPILALACGTRSRLKCVSLQARRFLDAGDLLHQKVTGQRRDRVSDQAK